MTSTRSEEAKIEVNSAALSADDFKRLMIEGFCPYLASFAKDKNRNILTVSLPALFNSFTDSNHTTYLDTRTNILKVTLKEAEFKALPVLSNNYKMAAENFINAFYDLLGSAIDNGTTLASFNEKANVAKLRLADLHKMKSHHDTATIQAYELILTMIKNAEQLLAEKPAKEKINQLTQQIASLEIQAQTNAQIATAEKTTLINVISVLKSDIKRLEEVRQQTISRENERKKLYEKRKALLKKHNVELKVAQDNAKALETNLITAQKRVAALESRSLAFGTVVTDLNNQKAAFLSEHLKDETNITQLRKQIRGLTALTPKTSTTTPIVSGGLSLGLSVASGLALLGFYAIPLVGQVALATSLGAGAIGLGVAAYHYVKTNRFNRKLAKLLAVEEPTIVGVEAVATGTGNQSRRDANNPSASPRSSAVVSKHLNFRPAPIQTRAASESNSSADSFYELTPTPPSTPSTASPRSHELEEEKHNSQRSSRGSYS